MFKYTDLPAFAVKYHQGDRTAIVNLILAPPRNKE
jgi:hypothetical protein